MAKEKVNLMEKLEEYIRQSVQKESEGKKLAQQSLENYITETLDMVVIKSESLGDKESYNERFKLTAKSKREGFNAEYVFVSDYYDSSWFTSRENALTLKEIIGTEGVHEVDEIFYFTSMRDESNRNHKLLVTPLAKLLSGELIDPEVDFVVNYLKRVFEGKFGYEYTEGSRGNQSTFRIEFNGEIIMGVGFSNTIQTTFRKKGFRDIQFIFRDKDKDEIKREVDKIYLLIEGYFNWNILIDDKHSLTKLNDFLSSKRYLVDVNTNALIQENMSDYTLLFYNFVIGDYSSYKQVDVSIGYNANTGQLELIMNYLFKEIRVLCDGVDEVQSNLEKVESWIC